jgi:hypothetical protein
LRLSAFALGLESQSQPSPDAPRQDKNVDKCKSFTLETALDLSKRAQE